MDKRKDRLRKVINPQSTSTWTVKDFPISIRSYEVGSCLTSQVFTANHEAGSSCWRIFCYPNGACEEARGHVSLFISSQFSSQIVGNYHFDIGLLTACGEFLYHGILYGTVPYQKHGIPRFISHTFLTENAVDLMPNDELTIYWKMNLVPPFKLLQQAHFKPKQTRPFVWPAHFSGKQFKKQINLDHELKTSPNTSPARVKAIGIKLNWWRAYFPHIRESLNAADWEDVLKQRTVDEAWHFFMRILEQSVRRTVPVWNGKNKDDRKTAVGPILGKDNSELVEDLDMAEELNRHFSEVFITEDNSSIPATEPWARCPPIITTLSVTKRQVLAKIGKMVAHSSPGPDGITPRLLKELAREIAGPLSKIFQKFPARGCCSSRLEICQCDSET